MIKQILSVILAVILGIALIIGLLYAGRYMGIFNIETERLINEKSRQYNVSINSAIGDIEKSISQTEVRLIDAKNNEDDALVNALEAQLFTLKEQLKRKKDLIK